MNFNQKITSNIELNEILFIKSGFKNAASKFGICLNNLPNKNQIDNTPKKTGIFNSLNFNSTHFMKGGYLKWTKVPNSNKWVPLIKIETEKPVVITRQILSKLDKYLSPNLKKKISTSLSSIKLEKNDCSKNSILNQSFSENNLVLDNQKSKSIIDGNENENKISILSGSSRSSITDTFYSDHNNTNQD
jgi:hypothetical protein